MPTNWRRADDTPHDIEYAHESGMKVVIDSTGPEYTLRVVDAENANGKIVGSNIADLKGIARTIMDTIVMLDNGKDNGN